MAYSLSLQPQSLLISPTTKPLNPTPSTFNLFTHKPQLRHSITTIKSSWRPPSSFPDDGFIQELLHKTEGLLYTLADATVSVSSSAADNGVKDNGDWFSGITNLMETVLKVLKDGLSTVHVPYAYGFSIILLTVIVKAATFPLSKKQVESAMAMKSLQPQVKAIQQQYAGDQERIQLETARLYKIAGVNPLAGCLPTLATIPVWIGLYRALSNVANEGLLTEGFFWIPSLAGPTTVAAKQNGSGISWLFPFIDGHPPLGWSDTLAYLVLPVLLIISQYVSIQIMQSSQSNDPNMKTSQALTNFLPLMIGYFALSVPSGLSLYWLTNNILSTTQQVWLQKLGGAKKPVMKFSDDKVKEVQQKLQESISSVNSTKVVQSREEESSSTPRPGDRFKQLKEQEARKKQQKEELRKLSTTALETTNTEQTKQIEVDKSEIEESDAKSVGVRSERDQSVSDTHVFSTGVSHVNGEHSLQSSEDNQKSLSEPVNEEGSVRTTVADGKEELLLIGKLEKEDAAERYTTAATAAATNETAQHGKVEQPKKGDDN